MTDELVCRCGHERRRHSPGHCATFVDGISDILPGDQWKVCPCPGFDDSRLPDPGERLTFGVHRQPSDAAETAEAWPPLPAWSARVKQHTARALRRLR